MKLRIKDIASAAVTPATDDFFAIDGATNSTRKLPTSAVVLNGGSATITVLDSGSSPNLTLQTGGATRGQFSSTGLAVNGTGTALTVNSTSASGLAAAINSTSATGTFFAVQNSGTAIGFIGDALNVNAGTLGDLAIRSQGTGLDFGLSGSRYMRLTSTGLAVTGELSATGILTTSGLYNLRSTGDLDTTGTAYISLLDNSTGSWVERGWVGYGAGDGNLAVVNNVTSKSVIIAAGGTNVATFSSTGLAVTGALSATGVTTISGTSGNVFLVGTSTSDADYRARIDGGSGASWRMDTSADSTVIGFFRSGTNVGTISVTTTATAYSTSSDARLKTNVRDYSPGNLLDLLKPRIFDWKTGHKDSIGFVAQELNEVYPQAVSPGDDGEEITQQWGVDFSKLVPVLVAELKALRARVAQLEAHV